MAQENTGLRIQRGSPGARLSIGHWLWARHPTSSLTVLLFDPLSYRNVTNRRMSCSGFLLFWVLTLILIQPFSGLILRLLPQNSVTRHRAGRLLKLLQLLDVLP